MPPVVQSVVAVPGDWSDPMGLARTLVDRSGLLFNPPRSLLIDKRASPPEEHPLGIELLPRDPRMRMAFDFASRGKIPAPELDAIMRHTLCAYLVDEHGGSLESARRLLRVASALLEVGGLAAKVESAGVAHTKERWLELASSGEPASLVQAFVSTLHHPDTQIASSFGMHNLGLPDARTLPGPADRTLPLLEALLLRIASGSRRAVDELFTRAPGEETFRLAHVTDERYGPGHLFHNPFGVWVLETR